MDRRTGGRQNMNWLFLVNGVRATNVAAFRIDPAYEEAKAPVFEVGVLERPPLEEYSRPLLGWLGRTAGLRRITTLAVTRGALAGGWCGAQAGGYLGWVGVDRGLGRAVSSDRPSEEFRSAGG